MHIRRIDQPVVEIAVPQHGGGNNQLVAATVASADPLCGVHLFIDFDIELPGGSIRQDDLAKVGVGKSCARNVWFGIQVENRLTDGINFARGNHVIGKLRAHTTASLRDALGGIKDRCACLREITGSFRIGGNISFEVHRIFFARFFKVDKEEGLVLKYRAAQ